MDAADAAGREDADPDRARGGEGASHRRCADRSLDGGSREVPWPDLARERPEASELLLGQPDVHFSVQNADGRGNRTRRSHLPLRLEPHLHALAGREAVRDERGLERDDGAARGERLAHFVGDADHAERSISTKRLSSPRRTSWKPARR